jgi:hypothetical protein
LVHAFLGPSARGVRLVLVAVLLWAGMLFVLPRSASAEPRSPLEESVIAEALEAHELEVDPAPAGKVIEAVDVYVLEVFDQRDPVPKFVNALHTRTRKWVIEQEVLQVVGDRVDPGRILETERNLRRLRQLSLANVVVTRGSEPGKARLLVVVKDVWSLRLNSDIGIGESGLDYLLLNPAEENLAGTHITAGALYLLERARQSFGLRFVYPRLASSRFTIAAESSFSTNNESGALEGSAGMFIFQLPLYSRHRHFAYGTEVAWNFQVARRYDGNELATFDHQLPSGEIESVDQVYYSDRLAADYWLLRSFGVRHKFDLSLGLEIDARNYRAPDLSAYSPETQAAFENEFLPVSDRRFSPYVQVRSYRTDFVRALDFELLGVQEDIRVGHEALSRLYAAAEALGSSRTLVGGLAGVSYSAALGSGLVRAVAYSDIVAAVGGQNEGYFAAQGRLTTPTLGIGRLHLDSLVATRYLNYLNVGPFALGGNTRLRGYPANEFRGRDYLAINLEFRTRSIDILSAQVGLVTFLDFGDVPATLGQVSLKGSTGLGARILFPQATRAVFRIDWGFPITGGGWEPWPGGVYVTFGQAFDLPAIGTPRAIAGLSQF